MAARIMTGRERVLILVAAAIFFSILILPFARGLARDYRANRTELTSARGRLSDAAELRRIIEEERAAQKLIAERMGAGARFSLYDFTQSALTQSGLGGRMRLEKRGAASQQLEVVNVAINNVSLDELINFLHEMYGAGRPVALHQLDFIRPARDNKGIDCSMTLMSPRL